MDSEVGAKGGLRRPNLGIRSFCASEGMERLVDIWVVRSTMVAVGGKMRDVELPWWVIVMVMSSSEGAGSWGGEAMESAVLSRNVEEDAVCSAVRMAVTSTT